jgi:hypothetical protein
MGRRQLFADGWNSVAHLIFGIITFYQPWIMPLFILYQLRDIDDENTPIDLFEYYIGLIIVSIVMLIRKK